jgi:DNA-binding NtrC family response regulator
VTRQLELRDLAAVASTFGEAASPADEFEAILAKQLSFRNARDEVLALFRRRYVEAVLGRHNGNVGRAARASGIGRRYLQRLKAQRRSPS